MVWFTIRLTLSVHEKTKFDNNIIAVQNNYKKKRLFKKKQIKK